MISINRLRPQVTGIARQLGRVDDPDATPPDAGWLIDLDDFPTAELGGRIDHDDLDGSDWSALLGDEAAGKRPVLAQSQRRPTGDGIRAWIWDGVTPGGISGEGWIPSGVASPSTIATMLLRDRGLLGQGTLADLTDEVTPQ